MQVIQIYYYWVCVMFVVFQVQEGLPAGSLLGTLQAKDPDEGENGTIYYSLSGKQVMLLQ